MSQPLLLALLATLALAANAQDPRLPIPGQTATPPVEQTSPVGAPDPSALRADWWRYFEAEGKELDDRVIETSVRFEALLASLPAAQAAAARPIVQGIETNLDALARARAQPDPIRMEPGPFEDRYSIDELLRIAARLHRERERLRTEREDVAAAERAVRDAMTAVDTKMAAYLNLAESDPRRVLNGLEIMANRIKVGVAEEHLRVRKAALRNSESAVAHLASEQRHAIENLDAAAADLEALDQEIARTEARREALQEALIRHQTEALSVSTDNPAERATAPYRQQRVIRSAVDAAMADVELIRMRGAREVVEGVLDPSAVDPDVVRALLADWEAELARIRTDAQTWVNESKRERDRAGQAVAASSGGGETVISLFSLVYQDRLALAQETLVELERLQAEIAKAELLIGLLEADLTRREGGLGRLLARAELLADRILDRISRLAGTSLFRVGETPVTALGLVRVAVILLLAWTLSYWFRRALKRVSEHRDSATQAALYTVGRLFHYVVITIGLIVGLSSIGIDFTNFALVAGAIGIGLGFGLQSIVSNFVSGLILLFERSLKVGDFVELESGVAGEVKAINVRSTLINTNDNVDIVVPNSDFINHDVINWTLVEENRRIHIPFRVAYGTDKELVKAAALEAAEKVPHTLKTKRPGVWLVEFDESCLKFELVVWITHAAVKRPGAVNAAYHWEIETALVKYGIEIPFPQRELRLRQGFEGMLEAVPARGWNPGANPGGS